MQKKKTAAKTKPQAKAAPKYPASARAAAMARRAEESRREARRQLDERYRPMLEQFAAKEVPSLSNASSVIGKLLDNLSAAIPHYRYHPGEDEVFTHFLQDVVRNKAPKPAAPRPTKAPAKKAPPKKKADPNVTIRDGEFSWTGFTEEEVEEAKRALAVWRAQWDVHVAKTQVALLEMDDAAKHRDTWDVFSRMALGGERPKHVAAATGKSLYAVYQTKKRMTDQLKALVAKLSAL